MTKSKPIIIDGVNVSGCKLYRDEISFVGGEIYTDVCSIWIWQRDYSGLEPSCVMKCHCKDNKDCYFKQLARKTQECEELKREIAFGNNGTLADEIRSEVFKELNNENDQLKAENEQAKQKLKKIREVAKQMNNECFYNDFDCKDCDMKNGCTYFNKGKILQIIDE